MGKRLLTTPRSKVRSAIRMLFLRSRERATAIKSAKYTCATCGAKQSRKKGCEVFVEVHHKSGKIGNWEAVIDAVFREILCDPCQLEVLCKDCHEKETKKVDHLSLPGSRRRKAQEEI